GGSHPSGRRVSPPFLGEAAWLRASRPGNRLAAGGEMTLPIPAEVEAVFREFRTCEFSTLAVDGTPISWPMLPFFRASTGQFMTTTSTGWPAKAVDNRRKARVSL